MFCLKKQVTFHGSLTKYTDVNDVHAKHSIFEVKMSKQRYGWDRKWVEKSRQ